MSVIEGAGSYVKINRTTTGWTWNVFVSAAGNSIKQLQESKSTALLIDAELRDLFPPEKKTKSEPVEAPF